MDFQSKFNRTPTEKEMTSYEAFRSMSDLDWSVMNNQVFTDLQRKNYQELSFSLREGVDIQANAKVVERLEDSADRRFLIAEGKDINDYADYGSMTSGRVQEFKDKGYTFIEFDQTREIDGLEVDFIVAAPKQSFGFRPLRPDQLGYVQGGSRLYNNWMIMQPRLLDGVDGVSRKGKDKAVFNLEFKSDAIKAVDNYNDALNSYRSALAAPTAQNIAEASDIIARNTRFDSYEDFAQAITNGKILDEEFELVRSGSTTTKYTQASGRAKLTHAPNTPLSLIHI